MRQLLFLYMGVCALLLSPLVMSNEIYACLHNGLERTIKVSYANSDSQVPCKVVYEKSSGAQILWSSESEAGYCQTKAAEFVASQRGWGWNCTKMKVTVATQ